MLRLAAAKLAPGGLLAVETPNPECLAILASHFYLDPHPPAPRPALLLAFYLEEFGFGELQTIASARRRHHARPEFLPPDFRDAFSAPSTTPSSPRSSDRIPPPQSLRRRNWGLK